MEVFVEYMLFFQILFVFVIPFICVVISGSIAKGVFGTWFLFVSWYILLLGLNPLFAPIGVELIDGPELFLAVIIGWFPGLIISGLAMLFREPLLRIVRSLRKRTSEETKSSLEKHNICYNQKQ